MGRDRTQIKDIILMNVEMYKPNSTHCKINKPGSVVGSVQLNKRYNPKFNYL